MIILHLCMRISYIQYTTCDKIMEGIKKGLLLTQQSFFVVRLSFIVCRRFTQILNKAIHRIQAGRRLWRPLHR